MFPVFIALILVIMTSTWASDDHQINKRLTWREGLALGADRYTWAEHCDFHNNDIQSIPGVPSNKCAEYCAQHVRNWTRRCTHFMWSPAEGGICYMKSSVSPDHWKSSVSPDQAFYKNEKSICGVMINEVN